MDPKNEKEIPHRVIAMLDRGEIDFLDKLKKDASFSGGKLTYNDAIKALVDCAMEAGISGKDVSSKESLKEKMLQETIEHVEEKLAKVDFGALLEAGSRKEKEKLLKEKLSEINTKKLFTYKGRPRRAARVIAWLLIAGLGLVVAGDRMNNNGGRGTISTLSLPGGPGFPAAGGYPQNANKDKERIDNYRRAIRSNLNEIRKAIKETGDGGREFVANHLMKKTGEQVYYLCQNYDYQLMVEGKVSQAFNDLQKTVDTYLDAGTLGVRISDLKSSIGMTLANGEIISELLRYRKLKESPYPVDSNDRPRAALCLAAIEDRNNALVNALLSYIDSAEAYLMKVIVWNGQSMARDPLLAEALYARARNGAQFSYNLMSDLRKYNIFRTQQIYNYEEAAYKIYEGYYDKVYQSYVETVTPVVENVFQAGWSERQNTGSLRTDWDAWRSLYNTIGHYYSENESVEPDGRGGEIHRITYTKSHDTLPTPQVSQFRLMRPLIRNNLDAIRAQLSSGTVFKTNWVWVLPPELDPLREFPKYQMWNSFCDKFDVLTAGLQKDLAVLRSRYSPYLDDNNPPVAVAGEYPAQKLPCEITLDAKGSSDADPQDKGNLQYRWVIIGIPETGNARSQEYAFYQTISKSQTALFRPDLAGIWVIRLEVNDATHFRFVDTGVTAIRHILWVQHSNGPWGPETKLGIDLRLYNPNATPGSEYHPERGPTKPEKTTDGKPTLWGGGYYLEVSYEKSGLYANYNDDGMPVDKETYALPQGVEACFSLSPPSRFTVTKGVYDGLYGSTDLTVAAERLKKEPGDFILKSGSSHPELAEMTVTVLDDQITDLVLSDSNCPYGRHIPASAGKQLEGDYYIQQWIDHYEWLNTDGKGFLPVRKARFGYNRGYLYVPDWMERRAAETLEKWPEVMPFVKRILNLPGWYNKYLGLYYRKSKQIWIGSYYDSIRYNLQSGNGYGFNGNATLDDVARHEAYHSYYFNNLPFFKDMDGDECLDYNPGQQKRFSDGQDVLQYVRDSADNFFGMKEINSMQVIYEGDERFDSFRRKYFLKVEVCPSVEDIETKAPILIDVPLPGNIPISEVFVTSIGLNFTPATLPLEDDITFLNHDVHFTFDKTPIFQKTEIPKLRIKLINGPEWRKLLNEELKQKRQPYNLFINFRITTAHDIHEYDASRIEPGNYTGEWSVGDLQ